MDKDNQEKMKYKRCKVDFMLNSIHTFPKNKLNSLLFYSIIKTISFSNWSTELKSIRFCFTCNIINL